MSVWWEMRVCVYVGRVRWRRKTEIDKRSENVAESLYSPWKAYTEKTKYCNALNYSFNIFL